MAELIIRKKYSNPLEYMTDMAKTSGYYDTNIASDSQVGAGYTAWLAKKRIDGADMSFMSDVDLSYLGASDAFSYLLLKSGDMSEQEWQKENASWSGGATSQQYFDAVKDYGYRRSVYESLNDWQKFWNGVGYVAGSAGNAILQLVEGLGDAVVAIGGGIAGIFDNKIWEDTENIVRYDFTGAGKNAADLEQFRHDTVDWDAQWTATKIIGDVFNGIVRMAPMIVTTALTAGAAAPAWLAVAGQAVYYTSSFGGTVEEHLNSDDNATLGAALAKGAVSTAIEIATEKISGDKMLGIKGWTGKKTFNKFLDGSFIGRTLAKGAAEGFEEIVAEYANAAANYMFNWGETRDIGQITTDALYCGLVGAITGSVLEDWRMLKTPSLKTSDGKKLGKAKTVALYEQIGEASDLLNKLTNSDSKSKLEKLRLDNNLSVEQVNQIKKDGKYKDSNGETIEDKNLQAEINSLSETVSDKDVTEMYMHLGTVIQKLGAAKFTEALDITAKSVDEQRKNLTMFAKVTTDPKHITDETFNKIQSYNQNKQNSLSFCAIDYESSPEFYAKKINEKVSPNPAGVNKATLTKIATQYKKKTGKNLVFGRFVDDNYNTQIPTTFTIVDKDTMFVSLDAYVKSSPQEFDRMLAVSEVANDIVEHTSDDFLKDYISEMSLDTTNMSKQEVIASILQNKAGAIYTFGTNKKLFRNIIKLTKQKAISEPDKAIAQYLTQLAFKTSNAAFELVRYETSETQQRTGETIDTGVIPVSVSNTANGNPTIMGSNIPRSDMNADSVWQQNLTNILFDKGLINTTDNGIYDFLSIATWTAEGQADIRLVLSLKKAKITRGIINRYLLYKYGLVAINDGKLLVKPHDTIKDLINDDAFYQSSKREKLKIEKGIKLIDFIKPEQLNNLTTYGLISKEQLNNTKVNLLDPNEKNFSDNGSVTVEENYIAINIVNNNNAVVTLIHEIVHMSLLNNKLPAGYNTEKWDEIARSLSDKKKNSIYNAWHNESEKSLLTDVSLTEIEKILYVCNIGEQTANGRHIGSFFAEEKKKNGSTMMVGYGKFVGIRIKDVINNETPLSNISTTTQQDIPADIQQDTTTDQSEVTADSSEPTPVQPPETINETSTNQPEATVVQQPKPTTDRQETIDKPKQKRSKNKQPETEQPKQQQPVSVEEEVVDVDEVAEEPKTNDAVDDKIKPKDTSTEYLLLLEKTNLINSNTTAKRLNDELSEIHVHEASSYTYSEDRRQFVQKSNGNSFEYVQRTSRLFDEFSVSDKSSFSTILTKSSFIQKSTGDVSTFYQPGQFKKDYEDNSNYVEILPEDTVETLTNKLGNEEYAKNAYKWLSKYSSFTVKTRLVTLGGYTYEVKSVTDGTIILESSRGWNKLDSVLQEVYENDENKRINKLILQPALQKIKQELKAEASVETIQIDGQEYKLLNTDPVIFYSKNLSDSTGTAKEQSVNSVTTSDVKYTLKGIDPKNENFEADWNVLNSASNYSLTEFKNLIVYYIPSWGVDSVTLVDHTNKDKETIIKKPSTRPVTTEDNIEKQPKDQSTKDKNSAEEKQSKDQLIKNKKLAEKQLQAKRKELEDLKNNKLPESQEKEKQIQQLTLQINSKQSEINSINLKLRPINSELTETIKELKQIENSTDKTELQRKLKKKGRELVKQRDDLKTTKTTLETERDELRAERAAISENGISTPGDIRNKIQTVEVEIKALEQDINKINGRLEGLKISSQREKEQKKKLIEGKPKITVTLPEQPTKNDKFFYKELKLKKNTFTTEHLITVFGVDITYNLIEYLEENPKTVFNSTLIKALIEKLIVDRGLNLKQLLFESKSEDDKKIAALFLKSYGESFIQKLLGQTKVSDVSDNDIVQHAKDYLEAIAKAEQINDQLKKYKESERTQLEVLLKDTTNFTDLESVKTHSYENIPEFVAGITELYSLIIRENKNSERELKIDEIFAAVEGRDPLGPFFSPHSSMLRGGQNKTYGPLSVGSASRAFESKKTTTSYEKQKQDSEKGKQNGNKSDDIKSSSLENKADASQPDTSEQYEKKDLVERINNSSPDEVVDVLRHAMSEELNRIKTVIDAGRVYFSAMYTLLASKLKDDLNRLIEVLAAFSKKIHEKVDDFSTLIKADELDKIEDKTSDEWYQKFAKLSLQMANLDAKKSALKNDKLSEALKGSQKNIGSQTGIKRGPYKKKTDVQSKPVEEPTPAVDATQPKEDKKSNDEPAVEKDKTKTSEDKTKDKTKDKDKDKNKNENKNTKKDKKKDEDINNEEYLKQTIYTITTDYSSSETSEEMKEDIMNRLNDLFSGSEKDNYFIDKKYNQYGNTSLPQVVAKAVNIDKFATWLQNLDIPALNALGLLVSSGNAEFEFLENETGNLASVLQQQIESAVADEFIRRNEATAGWFDVPRDILIWLALKLSSSGIQLRSRQMLLSELTRDLEYWTSVFGSETEHSKEAQEILKKNLTEEQYNDLFKKVAAHLQKRAEEISNKEKTAKDKHKEKTTKQNEVNKYKELLKRLSESYSNIESMINTLENDNKTNEERLAKLKQDETSNKDKIKELEDDIKTTQNEINTLKNSKKNYETEKKRLEKKSAELNQEIIDLNEAIIKLDNEIKNIKANSRRALIINNIIKEYQKIDPYSAQGVAATITLLDQLSQLIEEDKQNGIETEEELLNIQKILNTALDEIKSKASTKYNKKTHMKQVEEKGGKVAVWWEKAETWRFGSMLSAPSTWARNYIVNALIHGLDEVADALMNVSGKVWDSKWENAKKIKYYDDRGIGQTISINQWKFKNSKPRAGVVDYLNNEIITDQALDALYFKNHKQSSKNSDEEIIDVRGVSEKSKTLLFEGRTVSPGEVHVKRNFIMRLINWALESVDRRFIGSKFRSNAAKLIQSNAERLLNNAIYEAELMLGLSEVQIAFRVASLTKLYDLKEKSIDSWTDSDWQTLTANIVDSDYIELLRFARQDAERTFFYNNNAAGRAMKWLSEKHPLIGWLISLPIPFARMAWNITRTVIDYSPAGFISVLCNKAYWNRQINMAAKHSKATKAWHESFEKSIKDLNDDKIKTIEDVNKEIDRLTKKKQAERGLPTEEDDKLRALWAISKQLIADKDVLTGATKFFNELYLPSNRNKVTQFEQISNRKNAAKAFIGTSFLILGAVMSALGWLKIDDDDYMGAVIDIGGVKVRLNDLAPVTSSIVLGSYITYAIKNPKEVSFAGLFNAAIEDTIFAFATDAIEYADNPVEMLLNTFSNGISQYIPNVVKKVNKIFDNTSRQKSTDMWLRTWENIMDAIPGIRLLALQPKIDPYTGDVVRNNDPSLLSGFIDVLHIFSPIMFKYRNDSPIEAEAKRIGAKTVNATGRFSYNNVDFALKPEELLEFKQYRAKYISSAGNKLVSSEAYKKLTDDQKRDVLKKLYSKASEHAKKLWLQNNSKDVWKNNLKPKN